MFFNTNFNLSYRTNIDFSQTYEKWLKAKMNPNSIFHCVHFFCFLLYSCIKFHNDNFYYAYITWRAQKKSHLARFQWNSEHFSFVFDLTIVDVRKLPTTWSSTRFLPQRCLPSRNRIHLLSTVIYVCTIT